MSFIYKRNYKLRISEIIIVGLMIILSQLLFPTHAKADSREVELQLYMQTLSTLPEYCQYRLAESEFRDKYTFNGQTNWPPNFQKSHDKWVGYIGIQNWTYVHHYCFGLRAYNEYSSMSFSDKKRQKQHILRRALEEFEFMRNAQISNFPFMYNLYTYEALIYTDLGDHTRAAWALKQSQRYKKNRK